MSQQYQRVLKSTNIEGLAYDQKGGVGYVEFIGGRRFGRIFCLRRRLSCNVSIP